MGWFEGAWVRAACDSCHGCGDEDCGARIRKPWLAGFERRLGLEP